jgi:2-methylcitrate dehydratase PrpD
MKITRTFAEFVAGLTFDDIPREVLKLAKNCVLDTVGVAVFATQTTWGQIMIDYALMNACIGGSTILGVNRQRFNPCLTALVNGTAAHGFELDDVHYPSISHPGAVVVPAALALAEAESASGKTFLTAVVAGYEVMGRVGAAVAQTHLAKGFHPTGTFGSFGSTAASAAILGLDTDSLEDAFGIVGSFASGLAQFSITGSMVKRIHAGQAAESGIKATYLAKKGFSGPREILEGKYGFLRVFNENPELVAWERLTEDLGHTFVVQELSVKPSAACGVFHSVIDCLVSIDRERQLAAEAIESILVLGHENLANEHNVYEPQSVLSAQYSLPFTVGLTISGGIDDPNVYLDESILAKPDILQIGSKVKTEIDEEIKRLFPAKFGATVRVTFKDGTTLERKVLDPLGSTNNPFSADQLKSKFLKSTQGPLSRNQSETLMNRILHIEDLPDMGRIFHEVF